MESNTTQIESRRASGHPVARRRIESHSKLKEYVCKKQFTVKVGTVLEDSPISLDKWMTAIWMLGDCQKRISSCELATVVGVRQNRAWFILRRIREAKHCQIKRNPLNSELENC